MIIETSALIAILREEPEADDFLAAIAEAEVRRVSAANVLEAHIVLLRSMNARASAALDPFLVTASIIIEPVTADQVHIARQAYREYGRGSGHPAGLNFGDCFAYALAKATNEPLLFKGSDFVLTDVRPAV